VSELVERTAIVTGGGSGIGLAIAERLAADGMAVAIFDRDGEAADAAAAKIIAAGGTAAGYTVDVTDRPRIDAAVAEVAAALGMATVLVNNAGLDGFDPFLTIKPEKWARLLEVNLTGTFHCCQAVVPGMIEAGWGRIVNISSSSAQGGQPLMTHYVASKAGVIGFTKALALELAPQGITVNTIPPGFIDTPMLRRTESKGPARQRRRLPRVADPGASRRPARGHRGRHLVPRAGRSELHHGPGHRRERRSQHMRLAFSVPLESLLLGVTCRSWHDTSPRPTPT
jgi:NAD(P)-dependent dehydrogenase (short-subunit alcohol dehydrogenase family)